MTMVFKFATGAHLRGDPQQVGEALTTIRDERGRLTAADVVSEARGDGHVLHGYFEWNDLTAAHEYRLTQARHLIRSVVVVPEDDENGEPIRAFAKVNVGDEGSYEPIHVIVKTPELRVQVLEEIKKEIASLRKKLKAIEGLGDVLEALDRVHVVTTTRLEEARA